MFGAVPIRAVEDVAVVAVVGVVVVVDAGEVGGGRGLRKGPACVERTLVNAQLEGSNFCKHRTRTSPGRIGWCNCCCFCCVVERWLGEGRGEGGLVEKLPRGVCTGLFSALPPDNIVYCMAQRVKGEGACIFSCAYLVVPCIEWWV